MTQHRGCGCWGLGGLVSENGHGVRPDGISRHRASRLPAATFGMTSRPVPLTSLLVNTCKEQGHHP